MTDLFPFDIREQQERDNDKRHVSAIRKKEADALWAWMMSGPQGRRFIWNLMQSCGHGASSFSPDMAQMAFAEGRKSVAYGVEQTIRRVSPKNYLTMIEENHDRTD